MSGTSRKTSRCAAGMACVIVSVCCSIASVHAAEPALPTVDERFGGDITGDALTSIFNPQLALQNKTMGLAQRNFLDLVEESRPNLQIALVIDGTDSMKSSLDAIRATIGQMIEDLSLYKGANVSFQLVVFRDSSAAGGEVIFPMVVAGKKFTSDRAALQEALKRIETDSGAPYFYELIDMGIEKAIQELAWSGDEETTRWLLVFGDAPPFDAGFDEPQFLARRRVATDQLISLATNKGIRVNCVLCPTRKQDQDAYESVLDKTRRFMSSVSTETGGLMLDLSYPDIRRAIRSASKKPRAVQMRIGRITEQEVEAVRRQTAAEAFALSDDRKLRVVILPHLPLSKLSFSTQLPEVRIAADLHQRMRRLPGVEVVSSGLVRRQLASLQRRNVTGSAVLQTLAATMKADYVLWGTIEERDGGSVVESAIYDGMAGRALAKNVVRSNGPADGALTSDLIKGLIQQASNQTTDRKLQLTMASLQRTPDGIRSAITRVSNSPTAETLILTGYEMLEQATAFQSGDDEGLQLLQSAERSLAQAVSQAGDPRNAYGHYLLATSLFNQAQYYTQQGDLTTAGDNMREFRAAMNQAFQHRGRAALESIKIEIDADFALLIRKSPESAIENYERMAGMNATPVGPNENVPLPISHSTLRAHWMLAGIYSGDWGVGPEFRQVDKARFHLLQILAHWPDSREAEFIRKSMRWDEETHGTEFEHFPAEHAAVVGSDS